MIRVLAHQRPQAHRIGKILVLLPQMQQYSRATIRLDDILDTELTVGAGFPVHALGRIQTRAAREHFDPGSDNKAGIEPDAELTDELRILLLIAGQLVQKFRRSGVRDRAEVLYDLVARHTDAVVIDGHRARVPIVSDPDAEIGIAFQQCIVGQRLEPQLVGCVGGVRYELAKKYLLVAVQRMNHEVQQLLHLCLEAQGLPSRFVAGLLAGAHKFIASSMQARFVIHANQSNAGTRRPAASR